MIDRHPLRRDVVTAVLSQLVSGELPEGRVNESDLSRDLGISRTPLREALVLLEERGFLDSAMGRGFQVRPCSAGEAREIYPLLALLEPFALTAGADAARAAVPALRGVLRRMGSARTTEALLKLGAEWEERLFAGCTNRRLRAILDDLHALAGRYERASLEHGYRVASAIAKHGAILDRLEAGDTAAAARLLGETWNDCLVALLAWLEPAPTAREVRK